MARKQFTFYASFWEAVKDLPPELRMDVYDGMIPYALNGTEPEFHNPLSKSFFALIRPTLDSSRAKAENGAKGGSSAKNASAVPASPDLESKTDFASDGIASKNDSACADVASTNDFASDDCVSKTQANSKQNGSKTEAKRKQNGSTPEATCKQNESNEEATDKQPTSNSEAKPKQPESKKEGEKEKEKEIEIEVEDKIEEENKYNNHNHHEEEDTQTSGNPTAASLPPDDEKESDEFLLFVLIYPRLGKRSEAWAAYRERSQKMPPSKINDAARSLREAWVRGEYISIPQAADWLRGKAAPQRVKPMEDDEE